MKIEDKLKDNALNMKMEYQVNNRKICRAIDAIFLDEIKHFTSLFINFNEAYECVDEDTAKQLIKKIESIFNECKVVLVEKYQEKFEKNVDGLVSTMYDFFVKKINNPKAKSPIKILDKYLSEICKFECFMFENKLEDALIDFSDDFIYRYINSDECKKDFVHLMKNLNHSIVCEMKKAIANSIEDKQEIALRYNRINKQTLVKKNEFR